MKIDFRGRFGRESLAHEPRVLRERIAGCFAPTSAWNFARPDSGVRRATVSQQRAQRCACFFGRILCVRTGRATRKDRRALCGPDDPDLRVGWIRARHRADPCKTRLVKAARRATWNPTIRSTFRVPYWAESLAYEPVAAPLTESPWPRAPVGLKLCKAGFRGTSCCR
jgi:hypothetical protein